MSIAPFLRRIAKVLISRSIALYVHLSWRCNLKKAGGHRLPGTLSVTLTSYPPRFPTLSLTLKSIFAQTIRPDNIMLWIAHDDYSLLPSDVIALQEFGLTIATCEDIRSYKKIVPALREYPDHFFVTADDDLYYHRQWLRDLTTGFEDGRNEVLCTRARRIGFAANGSPLPYMRWGAHIDSGNESRLIFPTGIGGVLYKPGIFHEDVLRSDIFTDLCPTADDVWLYWMAALKGADFRVVGPRRREITWAESQNVALFGQNRAANDLQIANMIGRYGFPV